VSFEVVVAIEVGEHLRCTGIASDLAPRVDGEMRAC
jgi:hypothetical protein